MALISGVFFPQSPPSVPDAVLGATGTTPPIRTAPGLPRIYALRKFYEFFQFGMTTKSAKEIIAAIKSGHKPTAGEKRVLELDYCKNHIEYFIDSYGHIEDKQNQDGEFIKPFKMWKAQREALNSIVSHRWNIILKARQLGFSWLVMHIAAHLLITSYGKLAIGLSQSEKEAKELVRRLTVILRYMPELIAEKGNIPNGWDGPIFDSTALTVTITFPNGLESKFEAFPSAPGAGRSFTANLIILDEWAYQQYAEEIWGAAFPTINSKFGGMVIGLSTNQRGSFFEQMFIDPDNGFNKIFIPWYADPSRDDAWYERTKRMMGDSMTAEYPATIDEALEVPGGAFFPEVKKDTHETKDELKGSLRKYCAIDYGLDALAAIWINIDTKGNEQVYRCVKEPNLTVSQAAELLLSRSAYDGRIEWLAPDDLWSRNRETGRTTADIFSDQGISLVKVNRDLFNGCIQMKEHLRVPEEGKPKLTFLYGTSDKLIHDLQKIQKDKHKPTIYAKEPHDLTHLPDALRYFCTWWASPAANKAKAETRKRWSADLIYDWDHANKEMRELMREMYGEPVR